MVTSALRFNFNLLLAASLALVAGCQSSKEEKVKAVVRVHIEARSDTTEFATEVPIYRAKPVLMRVQKSPILSEMVLEKAEVVDTLGGFALQLQFNQSGTLMLEQYTAANPGRHLAIFSQFGDTAGQSRWLAAPKIGKRITNGLLVFTPDCTREEAERIALGLNNSVNETKRRNLVN